MNQVEQMQIVSELGTLPYETLLAFTRRQDWIHTARPDQLYPTGASLWLLLGGRGSGKTRAGAEDIWWSGAFREERIAIVGPTNNDVRKTCFEGESGLLACVPTELIENYNRSSLELWLKNGTYFIGYSSEEPERLRGPQHHRAWCDELAAWRYMEDTWDMLEFGMRLGPNPNILITTTPKPSKLLKEILADEDCHISTASTFDNAGNLPERYLKRVLNKYQGTRLGRQELYAEMLTDNPYSMWKGEILDKHRVKQAPELVRTVVSVDPPVTSGENADECGIVVSAEGSDGRWYVLDDGSCQGLSPEGWAQEAVRRYHAYQADALVAEVNQGGEMVQTVINSVDSKIPVVMVRASKGKIIRAEPISLLYEQGRVSHVGRFGSLEDQMCDFTTDFNKNNMGYSPDRVDALVWGMTYLALDGEAGEPRIRNL